MARKGDKRYYRCRKCDTVLDAFRYPPSGPCPHCSIDEPPETSRPNWANKPPERSPVFRNNFDLETNVSLRSVLSFVLIALTPCATFLYAKGAYDDATLLDFAPVNYLFQFRDDFRVRLNQSSAVTSGSWPEAARVVSQAGPHAQLDAAFFLRARGARATNFVSIAIGLLCGVGMAVLFQQGATRRMRRTYAFAGTVLLFVAAMGGSRVAVAVIRSDMAVRMEHIALDTKSMLGLRLHEATKTRMAGDAADALRWGAAPDFDGPTGITPLHYASRGGMPSVLRDLLSNDVDVNIRAKDGSTPLHFAIAGQNAEGVRQLIAKGADVNLPNQAGAYPIHLAFAQRNLDVVEAIVNGGANLEQFDGDGLTVMHHAALNGTTETVNYFLGQGLSIDVLSRSQETPLQSLLRELVRVLTVPTNRWSSQTPPQLEMMKYLVSRGANVNAADGNGRTVLHAARIAADEVLGKGYSGEPYLLQMTDFLVANGANRNAQDNQGEFAYTVEHAVRFRHQRWVEAFIKERPELLNKTDAVGRTLFQVAMEKGQSDMAAFLLTSGADIGKWTIRGTTPLHYAAGNGLKSVVAYLLFKEVEVNVRSQSGYTPLHFAAEAGNVEIVELLLDNGADGNIRNDQGETPLRLAQKRNHAGVSQVLRRNGYRQ